MGSRNFQYLQSEEQIELRRQLLAGDLETVLMVKSAAAAGPLGWTYTFPSDGQIISIRGHLAPSTPAGSAGYGLLSKIGAGPVDQQINGAVAYFRCSGATAKFALDLPPYGDPRMNGTIYVKQGDVWYSTLQADAVPGGGATIELAWTLYYKKLTWTQ